MYSEILADFIINLKFEKIPKNAIDRAKELMLDTIGVCIAGSNESSVASAIKAFEGIQAAKGDVEIFSKRAKFSPEYAAMLNAISSHALDFDDTHTEAILHASAILTPLCLTYGESLGVDRRRIITAFIAGWEIGARVGIASKGTFHKKGFHTTAIAGTFAATAAVCVLMQCNKEECINALGFAASFASGVNEFLSNGSNSKVLHVANCVQNAIMIGNLVKASMFGPVSIFEGKNNIFKAFGIEDQCDKKEIINGLGEIWQIMQVSLKPYPSCHFAHGFIECAIMLRNDGLNSDDISSIECFVDEVPIAFICDPIESKQAPQTQYEAKFSMPFLMALGFVDGNVTLKSFDNLARGEILSFAKKISYTKHTSSGFPRYFPGHLKATLKDGKIVTKDVFINKGNFENPLGFDEVLSKFMNCTSAVLTKDQARIVAEKIKDYA